MKIKMKKGIAPVIPLIVILALLLIGEYFVVSYLIRSEYVVGRFLSESIVLSEADKVETYVRSFQAAVELSLLQGCYEIKDHSQEIWQDYGSLVPDETQMKRMINDTTDANLENYTQAYVDFIENPDNYAHEIEIPDPSSDPSVITGGNVKDFEDNYISIVFNEIHFELHKENMDIDRYFYPTASIDTKLKEVWDQTNYLIDNNIIGRKINASVWDDACTDVNALNKKVNEALKEFKKEFDEAHYNEIAEKQILEITLENLGVENNFQIIPTEEGNCCQVTANVKVTMEDVSREYPVYNVADEVSEEYLGLIYKVRTGNACV